MPDPTEPTMMSGYAYELEGPPSVSYTATSDDWDTVVYTPTGAEKYLGKRRIDGTLCNLWHCPDARYRAQVAFG